MVTNVTLVAVGDKQSQKKELLIKYTYNKKRFKYFFPSIFVENFQRIIVDGRKYLVYFKDADPDDDFKITRVSSYKEANCILLCYSIGNKETFERIETKWIYEVRKSNPSVPVVLVGIGAENRKNKEDNCVSKTEGERMKQLIGATAFLECSVEKDVGIDDVFIAAIRSCHKYYY